MEEKHPIHIISHLDCRVCKNLGLGRAFSDCRFGEMWPWRLLWHSHCLSGNTEYPRYPALAKCRVPSLLMIGFLIMCFDGMRPNVTLVL